MAKVLAIHSPILQNESSNQNQSNSEKETGFFYRTIRKFQDVLAYDKVCGIVQLTVKVGTRVSSRYQGTNS